jgi:hypothetical protein
MTSQTYEVTETPRPIGGGRIPATRPGTAAPSVAAEADARDRDGVRIGLVAKIVAVAFWGGFLSVILGFAAAPVPFLLPLLVFSYGVFVLADAARPAGYNVVSDGERRAGAAAGSGIERRFLHRLLEPEGMRHRLLEGHAPARYETLFELRGGGDEDLARVPLAIRGPPTE